MKNHRSLTGPLLFVFTLLLFGAHLRADDCVWDGSTGNWTDTARWTSCGGSFPAAADNATVSSGSVTLTGSQAVTNFNLSGGTVTGAGDLTVSGIWNWTAGSMSGTGETVVAASGTLTISGGVSLGRTLTVNGTGNWTAGRIDVNNGTLAINGTFTTTTDNGFENFGGTPAVNNAGTFTKSTATGVSYSNIPFNNTGTITINSGSMNLNAGGTSTGSYTAAAGAALNFNGGTHDVTLTGGKSVGGAGTIGFTGGTTTIGGAGTYNVTGTSNVTGGTFNVNLAAGAGDWTQSGGALSGSGTVTVASGKSYAWSAGSMWGSAQTVIAAGATLTISGGVSLGRTLTVNGTGNWTAGRIDVNNGTLAINGTFTTTTDNGFENFGGTPAVNNAGTFTKSTATGVSYSNIPFNNTGTITINSGSMNLNAGGTSTGSYTAAAGAALNFNGGTHDVTLTGGKSVGGAGTIGFTGGTTTIGGAGTYNVTGTSNVTGGTVNLNLASGAGDWTQSGGALSGSGTVTVASGKSYAWSAGRMGGSAQTVIAAGATLTISGGVSLGRTLTVNGTGNWTAGRIDVNNGTLAINGTFTTTTDNGFEN